MQQQGVCSEQTNAIHIVPQYKLYILLIAVLRRLDDVKLNDRILIKSMLLIWITSLVFLYKHCAYCCSFPNSRITTVHILELHKLSNRILFSEALTSYKDTS